MGRSEERKTLDVIVMGVGEEKGDHDGHVVNPILSDHLPPQANDACASVNDDQMTAGTDFQAGGVATELVRTRSGFGIPAPHAPKSHRKGLLWHGL